MARGESRSGVENRPSIWPFKLRVKYWKSHIDSVVVRVKSFSKTGLTCEMAIQMSKEDLVDFSHSLFFSFGKFHKEP